MKTNKIATCVLLLLSISAVLSFSSCSKDHDSDVEETSPNLGYRIIAYANSTNVAQGRYLLPFDTLTSGSISPVNYGWELTGTIPYAATYYHKGYYYFYQDNQLNKYKIDKTTNQFTKVSGMVFTYFSPDKPYWVDDHTMVFVGAKDKAASYVIVDADNMIATASGKLDIPYYSGPTPRDPSTNAALTPEFNIFFFNVTGNKAVVGYSYSTSAYPDIHGVADVNYYAEMDYPSMKNVTIKQDAGNEYMSNVNFEDENGNIYLVTANYINDSSKNGVIRINKGEYLPDPSYFLEAIQSDQYKSFSFAIYTAVYLGNGKAFIAGHGEYNTYLLLDLNAKTVKDLGDKLPQNDWEFASYDNALVENNKLYFFASGSTSAIYEYDPATDRLTKGLELNGGVYAGALFHKVEGE
ncbi:hypothetical protein GCM10023231_41450 [Olivibacter ginsenosidimutans]|uniref:DUF4374 domain-containing protein n=1 Tax=Olivibacter ginsenosidimutans TaxID=1176537 RepID=A0ABP9CHJ5_9SPHI